MKQNQELRIISGKFRSRRIKFFPAEGLRPTSDRLRETLFNWLMQDIANAVCLDLFAGSGILSFEAISRGAKEVIAIESNAKTARQLFNNAEQLKIDNLKIYCMAFPQLVSDITEKKYDIIFLDPPFADNLIFAALEWIYQHQVLDPGGLIYLEMPRALNIDLGGFNWTIKKQTQIGASFAYLLTTR